MIFVLENASPHTGAGVALIANSGLDPSDALKLRQDVLEIGVIWATIGKTYEPIAIPVLDRLQAALDRASNHSAATVLAGTKGCPWTYNGFSTVWESWKRKQATAEQIAGDLTLEGSHHNMATILREGGADLRQIANLLGQKTESMANWYSRDAQLAKRNCGTTAVYENEIKRRQETVTPFDKTIKSE